MTTTVSNEMYNEIETFINHSKLPFETGYQIGIKEGGQYLIDAVNEKYLADLEYVKKICSEYIKHFENLTKTSILYSYLKLDRWTCDVLFVLKKEELTEKSLEFIGIGCDFFEKFRYDSKKIMFQDYYIPDLHLNENAIFSDGYHLKYEKRNS